MTTAVCADVTAFEPLVFVAVTLTRSVLPASAVTSVYVLWVAVVMSAHAAPVASQRDQRYANVIPLPVHVPGFAVSASPTTVGPDDRRRCRVRRTGLRRDAAVALEVAVVWPSAFVAVTLTRSRKPTSPAATT